MGLVSIITPIFNVAPYLAETIESVLRQTHAAFELLIVDDASTDDSLAIAERYASRDRRVRVWRQAKGGVVRARNAAVARARGEWLAFLDGDDRWDPEFLEAVIAEMHGCDENSVGAFTGLRLIEADGRVLNSRRVPSRRVYSSFDMLSGICPPGSSSCVIVRRETADAVGIFDESFDYAHFGVLAPHARAVGRSLLRRDSPRAGRLPHSTPRQLDDDDRAYRARISRSHQSALPGRVHAEDARTHPGRTGPQSSATGRESATRFVCCGAPGTPIPARRWESASFGRWATRDCGARPISPNFDCGAHMIEPAVGRKILREVEESLEAETRATLTYFRRRGGVVFLSDTAFWKEHPYVQQSLAKLLTAHGVPVIWFDGVEGGPPLVRAWDSPHLEVRRLPRRGRNATLRRALRRLGGNPVIWVWSGCPETLPYIDVLSVFDEPTRGTKLRARAVFCQNHFARPACPRQQVGDHRADDAAVGVLGVGTPVPELLDQAVAAVVAEESLPTR